MKQKMKENKRGGKEVGGGGGRSRSFLELDGKELSFRSIMKDVELLGSSDMTWKERKDLQNKKVVSLGGKAAKSQRLPLSVARLMMKNQKQREQKILQQELLCGHSGGMIKKSAKPQVERRRPENSVLRSSEGRFRNGVLDVKHLLKTVATPREDDHGPLGANKGKKNGGGKKNTSKGGKKNQGKRKGGGRKR